MVSNTVRIYLNYAFSKPLIMKLLELPTVSPYYLYLLSEKSCLRMWRLQVKSPSWSLLVPQGWKQLFRSITLYKALMRKYELPCASNQSTQLSSLTAVQADALQGNGITIALPKMCPAQWGRLWHRSIDYRSALSVFRVKFGLDNCVKDRRMEEKPFQSHFGASKKTSHRQNVYKFVFSWRQCHVHILHCILPPAPGLLTRCLWQWLPGHQTPSW